MSHGGRDMEEKEEKVVFPFLAGFMRPNGTQAFQLQHPMIAEHNMLQLPTLETGSPLVVPPITTAFERYFKGKT